MRKLVFASLLVGVLAQASACIIVSDDDEAGGRFTLDWTLSAGSGTISCADAGVDTVSSLATLQGTSAGLEDLFDCGDGSGTTALLDPGAYTVVVSILDGNTEVGTSQPRSEDIFDGETTDLGTFDFNFASAGSIDFSVDYDAAGGTNCGAGDPAPDDQNVSLRDRGGNTCIPTTLAIGDPNIADVTNLCNELAQCVESNVIQTLVDLEPGDYDLIIEGVYDTGSADVACYATLFQFSVDGDDDLGTIVAPFNVGKDVFCDTVPGD